MSFKVGLTAWATWLGVLGGAAHAELVRTRNVENCGVYLALGHADRPTDNSLSRRIAGLDKDELREALATLHDELGEDLRGDLAVTGLPLFDRRNRMFLDEVRRALDDVGLAPGRLRVIPMYRPGGRGLRYALARLRALLPMRQDFERPISEELKVGTPGVLAAELTTLGYSLFSFPAAVAIPMASGHLGLLATLSAFRRTTSNWMARSRNVGEELIKNAAMGSLFIINYNVTSRWPELVEQVRANGLGSFLTEHVPAGLNDFVHTQGVTSATQTIFFYLTFVRGVYRWEAMVAEDPVKGPAARRTAAALTPLVFSVSGPVLSWASTSTDVLARLGPLEFNPGQLTLLSLAAAGSVLAWRPGLLDHTIPWIERLVYQPLDRARAAWDSFRRPWARRAPTNESEPTEVAR